MDSVILKKEEFKKGKDKYFVYTTKKIYRKKRLLGDFKIFVKNNGKYLGDIYIFNLRKRIILPSRDSNIIYTYECEFIKNYGIGKFYCMPASKNGIAYLFERKMYDNIATLMFDIISGAHLDNPLRTTTEYLNEAKTHSIKKLSNKKIFNREYVIQKEN